MISNDVVQRALSAIKHTVDYQYFFDHLKSPDWIEPLLKVGMFKKPPAGENDGEYIRFPIWPESRYLARMSPLVPQIVLDIILETPVTDNVRVLEDFVDAAIAMPPELTAKLLEQAKKWAESPYQLLLPEKLGEMVSHLTNGRHVDEALDLARVLFSVIPDPRFEKVEGSEGETSFRPTPMPKARFQQWDYENFLEKHLPDLVRTAGMAALGLLIDLLTNALTLENQTDDYFYIWRPAIEDSQQNAHDEIRGILVNAVRDTALALASGSAKYATDVVTVLENQPLVTFERIALHVARVAPTVPIAIIADRIADIKFVDNISTHHEFWLLARDRLPEIDEVHRMALFEAIESGPDVAGVSAGMERSRGRPYSIDELDRYVKIWKLDRLSIIRDSLPIQLREQFENLEREIGERAHPEYASYSGGVQTGPNSPLESGQLEALSVRELILYLQTWNPTDEWMAPSREGLGRQLSSAVGNTPEKYALEAMQFKDLDPTYVHGLLQGFADAQKAKRPFAWPLILELCRWVVLRVEVVPDQQDQSADLDPDWKWTRKTIARLLGSGFDLGENEIPYGLRTVAWNIILPITNDPEPTIEYETKYGGDMDFATLSINTTRGEAMRTVIQFGLWVRRYLENSQQAQELWNGFDAIPEVREVLERHLDLSQDPSRAIRAVYGQRFPLLVYLDRAWSDRHVVEVFPHNVEQSDLRNAAWNAYIVFCNPYEATFEVLQHEYAFAIEQLSPASAKQTVVEFADERLAQHVMTYYWQGKLALENGDNLLGRFYAKASPSLRGEALEFIGLMLLNQPDEVLERIIDRLKNLWLLRFEEAKTAESIDDYREELAAFGWWFASGKFDARWAIRQLAEVLSLKVEVDADHVVAEHLAALATSFPLECMVCMRFMVEGDKQGWGILGWRESARAAISAALTSNIPEAKIAAQNLVHNLGARGHLQFRDLLTQANQESS